MLMMLLLVTRVNYVFEYVDIILCFTDLFLQTLHFSYLLTYFLQCMCYEVLV